MPLFEVEIQNRVVKGKFKPKRIKGTQGNWYLEKLYYLADSEDEAKESATNDVKGRRKSGFSFSRDKKLTREIEILNIRRIA